MDVVWHAFVAFDWIGLVVVPLLIVAARVTDVSMGTLRVVFIGRGMAVPAALVGFVESLVWLLAVSQILKHLTLPLYYVAYAGGFALGNYVGLMIERRLALGKVIVRVISNRSAADVVGAFREKGLGTTLVPAEGSAGPVHIVYSVMARRDLHAALDRLNKVQPGAFFTVEPVSEVSKGVFPADRRPAIVPLRQRK